MDEFKKPYEYEENEKHVSGLIFLFFIMLLAFEVLLGVIVLTQSYKTFSRMGAWGNITLVIACVYLAFILFTCIALSRIPRFAVQIAKVFLITRAVYLCVILTADFVVSYKNNTLVFFGFEEFGSFQEMVLVVLVFPLIYVITFSLLWFIYFTKSEKVKKVYGNT